MSMISEFKLLNSPFNENSIQLSNYLIQKIDKNMFHIHRELSPGEMRYYNTSRILLYKNRLYLKQISIAATIDEAESLINRYWGTIKGTKSFFLIQSNKTNATKCNPRKRLINFTK